MINNLKLPNRLIYILGGFVILVYWVNALVTRNTPKVLPVQTYQLNLHGKMLLVNESQYQNITALRKSFLQGAPQSTTFPLKCQDGSIFVFTGEVPLDVKKLRDLVPRKALDCRSRG